MAATPAPGGPASGKVIVNPLSGERISIRPGTPADGVLAWELLLAPGGRVPSSHSHPGQEECFTVLAGTVRFRVGWRRLAARPGEVVRVPPGTVHHFANPGRVPARVAVTTRPALSMAALLETAAVLAQEQQAAGRRLPRLLDLLLFMRDFDREVQAPLLPRLVRLVTRGAARLAARTGRDQRYRRLRASIPLPCPVPAAGRRAQAQGNPPGSGPFGGIQEISFHHACPPGSE